jgi:hypothetical protein
VVTPPRRVRGRLGARAACAASVPRQAGVACRVWPS